MAERPFSEHKYLVGRVRVDLSSIEFQEEIKPRLFDDSKVEKLLKIFNKSSQGCEQDIPENHISGIITPVELDAVLQTSGLTRDDLRKSLLEGEHPTIIALNKIYCLNGVYRIEAAKIFLGDSPPHERYWTVALYLFDLHDPNRATFIRRKAEQYSNEQKYTDGEVYLNVRHYEGKGSDDLVQDWMLRSSEGKAEDLSRLQQNRVLVNALDLLLRFPGLWDGLRLGYMRNILALHCEEELATYLGHIYRTWNQITLGSPVIQQAVNIQTVRNLHMRAPSSCLADRIYIAQEMDNGTLFPAIRDRNLRELIKREILSLQVMIPTIKSFQQNLSYFEIGAKILKSHVLNGEMHTTLYQAMFSIWSPPENFMVEFQEGEFKRVVLPAHEVPVRFFYKQLFLFVLRYKVKPIGPCDEPNDPECAPWVVDRIFRLHLLKRAELLGFRNGSALRELENEDIPGLPPIIAPSQDEQDSHGQSVDRRWGRPSCRDYKRIRTQLFLPKLLQTSVDMNVLFIQRDFLNAFFGSTAEFTVLPGRVVRLTQEVSATMPPSILQSSNIETESEPELLSHADILETTGDDISQESPSLSDRLSGVLSTEQVMSRELRAPTNSTSLRMNEPLYFNQSAIENSPETPEAQTGVGEETEYRISTAETEVARPISLVVPNNSGGPVDDGVETPRSLIDRDARSTTSISRIDTAAGSQSSPLDEDVVETPRSFIDIDARSTAPDSGTDTAVGSQSSPLDEDVVGTPRSFIDARSTAPDSGTDTAVGSQSSPLDEDVVGTPRSFIDARSTAPDSGTDTAIGSQSSPLDEDVVETPRSFIDIDARSTAPDSGTDTAVGSQSNPLDEDVVKTPRSFIDIDARPTTPDSRTDKFTGSRTSLYFANNKRLNKHGVVTPRSFIGMDTRQAYSPETEGATQSSLFFTNDIKGLVEDSVITPRSFIDVNTGPLSSPGTEGATQSSLHITNNNALLDEYGLLSRRSFIPLDVSTTSRNTYANISGIGPSHSENSRQGVMGCENSPFANTSSLYQTSPSTSRAKNIRLQQKKVLTSKRLRPLKLPKLVEERMYNQQSSLAYVSQGKYMSADSLKRKSFLYHNNEGSSLADPLYNRRSNLGLDPERPMAATDHYPFPSQPANRRPSPISVNSERLISKKIRSN